MRWVIGTYPIFIYCAVCSKTVFYPLAKLLSGTNMCLRCHIRIQRSIGRWGLDYLFNKLRVKYHCFGVLHRWYLEKGFVPYNPKETPSVVMRCCYCYGSKVSKSRGKEGIGAIETLLRTRNILRGKS